MLLQRSKACIQRRILPRWLNLAPNGDIENPKPRTGRPCVRHASSKKGAIVFFCTECGAEYNKWRGKCDACGQWNAVKEAPKAASPARGIGGGSSSKAGGKRAGYAGETPTLIPISSFDASVSTMRRESTGDAEFDRVLGGGVVAGSLTLMAGSPGCGKTTLCLQLAAQIARSSGRPVAYVSGEESVEQVAARARRVGEQATGVLVVAEADVDGIIAALDSVTHESAAGLAAGAGGADAGAESEYYDDEEEEEEAKPVTTGKRGWLKGGTRARQRESPLAAVVVDSIQTVFVPEVTALPGSVTQVRESAVRFLRFAKSTGTPVVLTGHVTKSGDLAGPRVLEHVVDTVLQLEGDGASGLRVLRCSKNRFGAASEVAVMDMTDKGLLSVSNPEGLFLSHWSHPDGGADGDGDGAAPPGTAVGVVMEGTRALCVEVQALAAPSLPDMPARHRGVGMSSDRMQVMMAVLNRRAGVRTRRHDLFMSAAGGMRLTEPGADLAMLAAAASALRDTSVRPGTVLMGEVGLAGEVRGVPQVARRINAALAMGFSNIIVPASNVFPTGKSAGMKGGSRPLFAGEVKKALSIDVPDKAVVAVKTARDAIRAALVHDVTDTDEV